MPNNWKNYSKIAEVIHVDFDNKRKKNPDEAASTPAPTQGKVTYEDSVGKTFAAPEGQNCSECNFDKFVVSSQYQVRCLRCFQEQNRFDPNFVSDTPGFDLTAQEAEKQGVHPSLLPSLCPRCGTTKSSPAEQCSHGNQKDCSECGAITRYLLQTTGKLDHPDLAKHHIKFHIDPSTGQFN